MIVVKLTRANAQKVIDQAAEALLAGQTVVYPTETIYGLGCVAGNIKAIKKIYLIKGRGKNKPLPLLLADLKMAKKYLSFNQTAMKLAREYWPGALSLVLPATAAGRKVFGRADIGARISSNNFASKLVRTIKQPLVSTSANPSGQAAAKSATAVISYFKSRKYKPDLVIDAGRLPKSKGSTFIDLTGAEPKLLRQGDITIKIQETRNNNQAKIKF